MGIQEMTKEQLISRIETLNKQLTEFKKTEKGFSALFDDSPIGLIITNAQGEILSANKIIQDLLGYTIDMFKAINIIDLYSDPKERDQLLDILARTNHVNSFETKVRHRDGSIKTVLLDSDYIKLDNEKVLLTSVHDITQFKTMLEDLRESEEGYHLLFSNAPVGITVTDFQGDLTVSNQAIQELLGYTAEDLENINAYDFYCDASERLRLLDLSQKFGVVRNFETKFKHKSGKILTVLINTDLIDFKSQHKVLLTSIRDITDLKKVEEELTRERDMISAILDIAASLIFVLDHNGLITIFNHACESTTGYTFAEMEGKQIWELVAVDPAVTRGRVEKLLAGNYPSTHEAVWIAKDGTHRLISWSNTVLLDKTDKVEYIVATGIDITEQRRAEAELKKANQELLSWINDLETRTQQMNQLSEMGEQLQSCQTVEEACAISALYIQRICPTSKGALYLINASKNLAEAYEMWGAPVSTEKTFLPLSCWAIRRGRLHLIDDTHPGLRCKHITGPEAGQYLCIPMLVNGEPLGILHLNYTASETQEQGTVQSKLFNEQKTQLVLTLAEHIALALSNLKLRETLRQQSIRDVLTGLFNRRYMEETLARELERAEREQRSLGIIMLDIDHFKQFNDVSGHDAGDAVLRELGVFLNKSARGGDIVCRYGGEEFVAVLPGATREETRLLAEVLREGVKDLLVYHLGKPLGKCTISLGVSSYPDHGTTREELLKNADTALYQAKNEGRDRVVVSTVAYKR